MRIEYDYFKITKEDCVKLMKLKKFNTSILDDDDLLFDFLVRVDKNEITDFNFNEKCLLYSYNQMLQSIAFSVDDIDYKMFITEYIKNGK